MEPLTSVFSNCLLGIQYRSLTKKDKNFQVHLT